MNSEAEWLACTNPDTMLYYLQGSVSVRKYRLFAAACCRSIWHLMTDQRSRRLVEVVERHLENQATDDEWKDASAAAHQAWADTSARLVPFLYGLPEQELTPEQLGAGNVLHSTTSAAWNLGYEAIRAQPGAEGRAMAHAVAIETARAVHEDYPNSPERPKQCDILRDIVGSPFYQVSLPQAILEWSDRTILRMAQTIYDDRQFEILSILADALEEAGCHDTVIMGHCRQGGEHVRGCWLIDLLLNKEQG
jgi:hypothetical protein